MPWLRQHISTFQLVRDQPDRQLGVFNMTAGDILGRATTIEPSADEDSDRPCPLDFGDNQRLFFFFHVPKTGGSTIVHALVQRFGRPRVIAPRKKDSRGFLVDILLSKKYFLPPNARGENLDNSHIVGHFASLSVIEGRESKYIKACFWRHPAEWFLSYYNWRNRKDRKRQKRSYSFSDFVRSLSHNPMSKDFLLYCGDVPRWRYFLMSDRLKFKTVVSIAKEFDVFADISRVDDYLEATGNGKNEGAQVRNRVAEQKKALKCLDPKTRHRLELHNPVDYYVYCVAMNRSSAIVASEAEQALTGKFQFRDIIRLLARPYYRLKVKLMPFL